MQNIQFPNLPFPPGNFAAQIQDNSGAPANVLEASKPFKVETKWDIVPEAARLLGGVWTVSVYAESIGPGPEMHLGSETVPLNGGTNYSATVTVPAGTLPNDPTPPASGIYKLVTVLTHRNFGKNSDVAGLVEGPVARIA
ncbi:MAG: hypothetical protein SYR96_13530 [Actinomycetota bacterium]|nr:hypothetical protein [Actinomycetota bacterium]